MSLEVSGTTQIAATSSQAVPSPSLREEAEAKLREALESLLALHVCEAVSPHLVTIEVPAIRIRIEPNPVVPPPTAAPRTLPPAPVPPPSSPIGTISDQVALEGDADAPGDVTIEPDDDQNVVEGETMDWFTLFD